MKLKRDSYLATIYTSLISREYVCSALIFCESNTFRDQLKNRKVFMLAKFAIKPYLNGRLRKRLVLLLCKRQNKVMHFTLFAIPIVLLDEEFQVLVVLQQKYLRRAQWIYLCMS